MLSSHDDLAYGHPLMVEEVDVLAVAHEPASPDQLLVNEVASPLFRFEVWGHGYGRA